MWLPWSAAHMQTKHLCAHPQCKRELQFAITKVTFWPAPYMCIFILKCSFASLKYCYYFITMQRLDYYMQYVYRRGRCSLSFEWSFGVSTVYSTEKYPLKPNTIEPRRALNIQIQFLCNGAMHRGWEFLILSGAVQCASPSFIRCSSLVHHYRWWRDLLTNENDKGEKSHLHIAIAFHLFMYI